MNEKKKVEFLLCCLEWKDNDAQHVSDINAAFSIGSDFILGTEAGDNAGNTRRVLRQVARRRGYRLHISLHGDTWVAVRRKFARRSLRIMVGDWIALRGVKKKWGDKFVTWLSVRHPLLGWITVGSVHYPRKALTGGDTWAQEDHAKEIGNFVSEKGAGGRLVITGGDANRPDKRLDLFFGHADVLTCWDELGRYPDTHQESGSIDFIGRYRPDTRVSLISADLIEDDEIHFNTDHRPIRVVYEIDFLNRR